MEHPIGYAPLGHAPTHLALRPLDPNFSIGYAPHRLRAIILASRRFGFAPHLAQRRVLENCRSRSVPFLVYSSSKLPCLRNCLDATFDLKELCMSLQTSSKAQDPVALSIWRASPFRLGDCRPIDLESVAPFDLENVALSTWRMANAPPSAIRRAHQPTRLPNVTRTST